MTKVPPESSHASSSNVAVVIVIAALLVLVLPCFLIIAGVSGFMFLKMEPARPMPPPGPQRMIDAAPAEKAMPAPLPETR